MNLLSTYWEALRDDCLKLLVYLKTRNQPKAVLPTNVITMPEVPAVPTNVDTLVAWTGRENCRHNVRVLCDLEGLNEQQKDDLSSTVHCESNYYPACIHANFFNGKVSSTDYGIAQINDFWHIGEGKDFPSSEYVLQNPEQVIRWMCKQWLAGNGRAWVCYLKGLNKNYSS